MNLSRTKCSLIPNHTTTDSNKKCHHAYQNYYRGTVFLETHFQLSKESQLERRGSMDSAIKNLKQV